MSFNLSDIAESRQEEISKAIEMAGKASNDGQALQLLLNALDEVRDAVVESAASEVTVTNQDVIKAEIRNSLNKLSKNVIKAIDGLKLDQKKIGEIKSKIEADNSMALTDRYDIAVTPKPRADIRVSNLGDIVFPDSFSIRNFNELKAYFTELAKTIEDSFNVEIPAPQVNVQAPEVNVAAPEISIPEIDLSELLKALSPLKFLSDRSNKPLAVRLSDGQKFIKAIDTIVKNQQAQTSAFSQGLNESSARKAFKQAIEANKGDSVTEGRKALTDSSAGVQVTATSTPIKYVFVSADTAGDVITVGGSTSTQLDSATGMILTPGTSPVRLDITNLNKLYASGATGSALCYTYFS